MKVLLQVSDSAPAVGEAVEVRIDPGAAARVEITDGRGLVVRSRNRGAAASFMVTPHTPLVRIRAVAPGWEPAEAEIRPRVEYGVMPNSIFESLVMAVAVQAEPADPPHRLGPRLRRDVDLSGEWAYAPDPEDRGEELGFASEALENADWKRMPVPSNFGRQDPELEDAYHPVWFRTRFIVPESVPDRRMFLYFEGVDYLAKVYLNGEPLDFGGEHEGYCNPFRFDISERVRPGDNLIAVRVQNPWDYGMESAQAQGNVGACEKIWAKGILNYHDTRPGSINLTDRDAQSRGTGGIFRPVSLRTTGEVSLDWVRLAPRLEASFSRGRVRARAILFNHAPEPREVVLAARAAGQGFEADHRIAVRATVPPGAGQVELELEVPRPRLWWPASHPELGRPELYELTVEVHGPDAILDQRTERFGFRDVRMREDGEEPWIWRLNGTRLFLRGANLIPTIYMGEVDRDFFERDLELMARANLDSLILLDHHQPELFYQICDERGVPVLQEFTLVWEYSAAHHERPCGDPALTSNVEVLRRILAESLLYLGNHPSVIWWSLHDEPMFTFGFNVEDGLQIPDTVFRQGDRMPLFLDRSGNRDLDAALFEVARRVETERPLHKTGNEGTESTMYYGWYTGLYTDLWGVDFPFPIEYGTEAVPFKAEAFIREHGEDLWPVTSEAAGRAWMYRCLQLPNLSSHIGRTTDYRSLADWAFSSQLYQALVLKYNIEYLRSRRYASTGSSYYFLFSSWWPSVTWGSMDDDRRPMVGYRWAAAANQPVLPFVPHQEALFAGGAQIELPVLVVNDLHRQLSGLRLGYRLVERADGFLIRADPDGFEEGFQDPFWYPKELREGLAVAGGPFDEIAELLSGETELDVAPDSLQQATRVAVTLPAADLLRARHLRLELALLDHEGRPVASNWHDLAVVRDPASFRPAAGISPLPRFTLELRGLPGIEVTVRRCFALEEPAHSSRLDAGGMARLEGLVPGVYRVEAEGFAEEVILDEPRVVELPAG